MWNVWSLDVFKNCKDIEVFVCRVVGDIPGSIEDGEKDFELETLDSLDVCLFG